MCYDCMAGLLSELRSRYSIDGMGESLVTVLSRAGERWRKLIGDEKLVEQWNMERMQGLVTSCSLSLCKV